ncbi:hypothetical protein CASFOL_022943 [Castilleja foliolosa]|uniref:Uncharacterized protein n=1 Tax=Castilleja foliolosa TaxID=1961234 RepID=A0ABD3CV35_9LAMI
MEYNKRSAMYNIPIHHLHLQHLTISAPSHRHPSHHLHFCNDSIVFEGQKMGLRTLLPFLCNVFLFSLGVIASDEHGKEETSQRLIITAPRRNAGGGVIDGSGVEYIFNNGNETGRVSVLTVALFTMAMAVATGLGALPFFFLELDLQWAGICNRMAAGVMLAASFDLIQEGQAHNSVSWVVLGILAGAIFIWLCKKVKLVLLLVKIFL